MATVKKKTARVKSTTKKDNLLGGKIREQVYLILAKESFEAFRTVRNSSESTFNTLTERLNAVEQAGIPKNTLEELKGLISRISYKQHQQQRAIEGLLQFFNITKNFFEEYKEPSNEVTGQRPRIE